MKAVLSPEQRESFILHNGTEESVLESLAEYMLPEHCIPTSFGEKQNTYMVLVETARSSS